MDVTIENPAILILGAFFSAVPFRNKYQLIAVQKLVLFYLACVLVNLVSDKYFTIQLWQWSVSISCGILGIVLFSGMFFLKKKTITKNEQLVYGEILMGWQVAFGIVAVTMVLLFFMLKWFYGYGFEHNLNSMGAMCGCFILFVCMWRGLGWVQVRLFLAIAFAVSISLINWGDFL